ncbi:MAG: Asp-tRNA(Asn)/Glu-tRNA(Gln) amidotransferase subunit GatB, partial [Terriglobia bacterium]
MKTQQMETVIGLEMHVELHTASKMFCGCSASSFGAKPNTVVCPVCLGLPGSLPVANKRAIELLIKTGLALNSSVAGVSQFHRKNYFYPDMVKNYQISQYDRPICEGGWLDIESSRGSFRVGITRIHLEEDTGKLVHVGEGGRIQSANYSLVDFNRSGVPLMEIVTEPDLASAADARLFLQELKTVLEYLEVSDCNMEEGSLRCDANVSVRPKGQKELGTKTEVKNMNSFRSLEKALDFEVRRQLELLEGGDQVVQETRHFDESKGVTTSLRTKEYAHDYRYFPEPDLVPLNI